MDTLDLDLNKQYTFADYLTWFDDKRRELIDGIIKLMIPAPTRLHQEVSMKLYLEIGVYLRDKDCKVYSAPFVRLPKNGEKQDDKIYNVVQPELRQLQLLHQICVLFL